MASYYDRPPPRDRGYDYGGPPPVSAADPYYPEPGASARRPRRGSILVDSAERDRDAPRRRHRSHSQVRLQEPEIDDSSDDDDPRYHPSSKPRSGAPPPANSGRKVRHRDGRDGRVDYVPDDADKKMNSSARRPKPRTRVSDLEEKEGPQFRDFRARRDGYEAEEGKTHRNLKSSRGDRAIYDDGDENDPYGLGGAGGGLPPPPVGSNRRGGPDPYDAALGAGAGAAAAAAGASARSGRRHEEPRRPRDRPPPTYHDDIGDRGYTSDAPKSRRNKDRSARQSLPPDYNRDRDRGDRYGGAPPPPRGEPHSSRRRSPPPAAYRGPSPERGGGRYDAPPPPSARSSSRGAPGHRRGASLPPKAMYDDDPPYGGRGEHAPTRSGSTRHPRGGPEDKHRARSAAYPQDPYYDFHDRRGGGGGRHAPRDPRDPRAPYEEVADPRRPRGKSYGSPAGGSGRGGEAVKKERTVPPWAKKAGGFLVSTAVPIIKQEGEKYLRKEMERRLHK